MWWTCSRQFCISEPVAVRFVTDGTRSVGSITGVFVCRILPINHVATSNMIDRSVMAFFGALFDLWSLLGKDYYLGRLLGTILRFHWHSDFSAIWLIRIAGELWWLATFIRNQLLTDWRSIDRKRLRAWRLLLRSPFKFLDGKCLTRISVSSFHRQSSIKLWRNAKWRQSNVMESIASASSGKWRKNQI